jgi:hypothetical protein
LSKINTPDRNTCSEARGTLLVSSRLTLQSTKAQALQTIEKQAVTRERAAKDNGVEISRQPNLNPNFKKFSKLEFARSSF